MRRIAPALCWIFGISGAVLAVTWWALDQRLRSHQLHPGDGLVAKSFDDRAIGGTSTSQVDTFAGRLRFRWTLGTDPRLNYTGFLLERPDQVLFRIDGWDSLVLDWESDRGEAVRISFLVDQPGLTVAGKPLTHRYLQVEGLPPRTRGRSSWALRDFHPPPWWFRENHQPLDAGHQFLDRVASFSVENGETSMPGSSDEVRIHAVVLKAALPSTRPAWILLAISFASISFGFFLRRHVDSVPTAQAAPDSEVAVLSPVPLDAPLSRSSQIRAWMEMRYSDPGASLETLGRELSLGPDATSREVRRAFQDTFKGALNRVRLQEARRLLKESDLGIAEIAYKVGYGNVSHFNRLAKDTWGCTPTEERVRARAEGQS